MARLSNATAAVTGFTVFDYSMSGKWLQATALLL